MNMSQSSIFSFDSTPPVYSPESLYLKIQDYIMNNLEAFYKTDLNQNLFPVFDLLPEMQRPGDLFFEQLIQGEEILISDETPEGITKGLLQSLNNNRNRNAAGFCLIFINHYFTAEPEDRDWKLFKFMQNGRPRVMLDYEPERSSGIHGGLFFNLIDQDCRIGFGWRYQGVKS